MLKTLTLSLTPSDDGVLVRALVWLFGINWKTSLNGVLTFLIVTLTTLVALLSPYTLTAPASKAAKLNYVIIGCNIILAFARVWVGLIQQDSGVQAVKLPNVEEPIGVPSHELPNQPPPAGAKIVKEP